jgi:hypothetical protein
MSKESSKQPISDGESIFLKVGLLIFLGILLLGLGAQRSLWTAAYKAFFVWLVFSLVAGTIAMGWRYSRFRARQVDLESNLSHARAEEERMIGERRERRDRMTDLVGAIGPDDLHEENMDESTPPSHPHEANDKQG